MKTLPKQVTAAVLIIGNEILSGRTQDSNLAWLAIRLNDYGIQIREARVVPDVESDIVEAVNALRARHDYLFTTGGIGPTHDDITAACIARAFEVSLVEHPEIAEVLRRRPAPPDVMAVRMRMALVPEGSTLVPNPHGPPGFCMENVYVLAGIPQVMQSMVNALEGRLRRGYTVRSRSVTAHVMESQIARQLTDIQARHPQVDLGSYPFYRKDVYGTTLVMRGGDESELEVMLAEVREAIVGLGAEPLDETAG